MHPPPGYHGCYLRVDVTTGETRRVSIGERVLRGYVGGCGLGVYLLLREDAARREPLSPDAAIAFVFSPLVGSPITTSAKFSVVSKSPLTDRINDSLAGGHFALAGKKCGCDAIVVVGRAEKPSILVIDDGFVELVPASEAWGMEIPDAEDMLRLRLGEGYRIAVIGPAGERLVRFATVSHDGRHAGRGGSGAVLGSKNLKAIAVRGTQHVQWASPDALAVLAKQLSRKSIGPATAKYRDLGTAANLLALNRLAALPTRNFQQGVFIGAESLAPEKLTEFRKKTRASCSHCTIGCEHIYATKGAPDVHPNRPDVRVEYENIFALGPLCGIGDASVVLRASERCDALGLDTISTGGTIAFAMECAERGLIDLPWLAFGDGDGLLRAVELTALREGIGRELSEGSRRMAAVIGGSAADFAPHVKGLEIPGYEPRALQAMAIGFAVGARGADHNRSGAYEVDFSGVANRRNFTPENIRLVLETEDRAAILDSAILCKFLRGVFDDLFDEVAEMLRLVTGWKMTAEELRTTARRIINAKKEFNIKAGWTPDEDTLPPRLLTEKLPEDARAVLSSTRLRELVRAYNIARGWNAAGWL